MKTVETKNKLIINDLVKKHFSLTKKSQKLFTQRLLYERPIAKEYAEILNGAEDLRARFDIDENFLEDSDQSWEDFQFRFNNYVEEKNIKYSNYNKNKILVNKNEKKILKDMIDFYNQKMNDWIYNGQDFPEDIKRINFSVSFNLKDEMVKLIYVKAKEFYREHSISTHELSFSLNGISENSSLHETLDIIPALFSKKEFENINISIRHLQSMFHGVMTLDQLFPTNEDKDIFLKDLKAFCVSLFENSITSSYSIVTQKKPFGFKNLELVVSLNYADWFLASTGDSWSSCISLYSTYDECFWTGIPNLIGDKSRAMVYITEKNGPKKDFYGIRTDKFLIRAWVQLFRTIPPKNAKENYEGYNKTFFNMIKPYPMELSGLSEKIEKLINIPSHRTIMNKYFAAHKPEESYYKSRSRYYAETFWFEKGRRGFEVMATVYLDKGSFKLAKKNKAKYFYGDYGYYNFDRDGGSAFYFSKNPLTNEISSISQLLSSGISFAEIIEDNSNLNIEINRWLDGYHRDEYDEDDDYYDEDYYDEEDVM